MAYIGNSVVSEVSTPSTDYFSGNGVTTVFTLTRNVRSLNDFTAYVNNVPQNPIQAYSITGPNQITFTSPPPAGTDNVYVRYIGKNLTTIAIGQGTVGTDQLGSVTRINSIGNDLNLQVNGTTALTVDQNQNLVIGSGSASFSTYEGYSQRGIQLLGVKESGTAPVIRMSETGSGLGNFEIRSTRNGVTSGNLLAIGEGTSTFVTVRSDDDDGGTSTRGFVGIGTLSPRYKLDIAGGSLNLPTTDANGYVGTLLYGGRKFLQVNAFSTGIGYSGYSSPASIYVNGVNVFNCGRSWGLCVISGGGANAGQVIYGNTFDVYGTTTLATNFTNTIDSYSGNNNIIIIITQDEPQNGGDPIRTYLQNNLSAKLAYLPNSSRYAYGYAYRFGYGTLGEAHSSYYNGGYTNAGQNTNPNRCGFNFTVVI